ncbi:MAG: isoleucine--tRNA ligase [Acholeplasmataceae bacterium]
MDYKDTLLMPKTEFAMRGNLGQRELEFQQKWDEMKLYEKVLLKNKDKTPFILHDGPPYANGNIHIGHAFQKTLKDFVLRYKTMTGHYVPYIPGWDTHGLPIENEVTKKGVNRKEVTSSEFRKICRSYALDQVEKQKEQFKRIGILGDWDNPYLTLDKQFIFRQIELFGKMVEKGLIYRGLKPVYWSPSSESALAEAEIEYHDKQSTSIYFTFPIVNQNDELADANLLIWTTTPWTLPANLAVSVHPDFSYLLVSVNGKKMLLLESLLPALAERFKWQNIKRIKTYPGRELEKVQYKHPLYDRVSPIILGEHVLDTDGTGLVHTAPGHGEDDYIVGRSYNLAILSPVDERGIMTEEAGKYAGQFYEKANDLIVEDLEKLGCLIEKTTITHSYPHDWRTRKPVIFRATPQWFANVKPLKEDLLRAIDEIKWYPNWSQARMKTMIENRNDWVISRQRAWGVPLPIFYAENNDPILDPKLINHVAKIFLKEGSDAWYELEAKDLLPKGFTHPSSPNGLFKKEIDIMDVWFDSGTSYSVLEDRGLPFPADLYLEGTDQFRGWFNSSITTAIAAKNQAPYRQVVTHGFVLDGSGYKMSKSQGNTIDPLQIMKTQGADLLRLWVATVDYQSDVRISEEMLKQIGESYRKIRNTIRFMLGNIDDFNVERDYISYSMRGQLNRVMTHKYHDLINTVIDSYEKYEFDQVYRTVVPFIINDLSAYYLDYTKDILYIEKEDNFERRAIQSTIFDILFGLLRLLNPILPHTTSEAYWLLPDRTEEDVYLLDMPQKVSFKNETLMEKFKVFEEIREIVLKRLEEARAEKVIGKSLQAHLELTVTERQKEAIDYLDMNIHQVLIVSKVDLKIGKKLNVVVKKADGHVCERCWNVVETVSENGLCLRCSKVMEE